jgi:hypothetical protein
VDWDEQFPLLHGRQPSLLFSPVPQNHRVSDVPAGDAPQNCQIETVIEESVAVISNQ